jgi:hypothetical protein
MFLINKILILANTVIKVTRNIKSLTDMSSVFILSSRLLFLSLFIFISHVSAGQLNIWYDLKKLHLEFSERDSRRIERIDNQKEIADNLIRRASESGDRKELDKAFNELFSASSALYDIYDQTCRTARSKLPSSLPPELTRAADFEIRSRENLDKSEILKKEAVKAEDFQRAQHFFLMAHDLELLALLSKGRALRIYQDFPVIYAYQWDDDITIMREAPERVVRVIKTEEAALTPDETSEDIKEVLKGITFVVQIAAHIEPIPQAELNAIYRGEIKINMVREDGWYKYYLGPYRSFEEADKVMKSIGRRNMFIAAYMDGRRIGINEARRKQAQQK